MNEILLASCVGTVISEAPFVKILSVPRQRDGQWIALAQVNEVLALIEVRISFPERTHADIASVRASSIFPSHPPIVNRHRLGVTA